MINMMQPTSPAEIEFQVVRAFLTVLTDPAGYLAKLQELDGKIRDLRSAHADQQASFDILQTETDKAHKAVAAAKAEADAENERKATELAVAHAALEQRAKLLDEREAHASEWEKQLGDREKRVTGREQAFRNAVSLVS